MSRDPFQTDTAEADILLVADFSEGGDCDFRLSHEIRHWAAHGLCVALAQSCAPEVQIAEEVRACVRWGLARIVTEADGMRAGTIVLHHPARLDPMRLDIGRIEARRLCVVCHEPADLAATGAFFAGQARVTTYAAHAGLGATKAPGPRLSPRLWTPLTAPLPLPEARPARPLALGWIGAGLPDGVPEALSQALAHELEGAPRHIRLDAGEASDAEHADGFSLDRLIAGIDAFIWPDAEPGRHDTLIAAALAAGRPVILPPEAEAHFGAGPLYAGSAQDLKAALVEAARIVRARARPRRTPAFVKACRSGPAARLVETAHPVPGHAAAARPGPVLCFSSNGVGVGHLTRLLAVCRHLGEEVVFATQAPGIRLVRSFGYTAEYVPSAATVGGDPALWEAWFRAHVDRLLDAYQPQAVVYDGNHLYRGLIDAVCARRDVRLVWMRRGMWARTTSGYLANAHWCDRVIEPGEIAAERDTGVTTGLKSEVIEVDPVRLLETGDLLPREEARRHLGLDPSRPAALIQLGSGFNRDLVTLMDEVVGHLRARPGLQIAVVEWASATIPLTLWPDVTVIRGFPTAQYLRAFDFCISAAGYNAYHELISYNVPAIFLANTHPSMDDQYGRAKFAQDAAAAFELSDGDLGDLPKLIDLMMEPRARAFLAENCTALARPNGAAQAAEAIRAVAQLATGDAR